MSFTCEGTLEIDLVEFWKWICKEQDPMPFGTEMEYGVPRINKNNHTMEIDFAASSDNNPETWFVKPKVFQQWEDHKDIPN